MPVRAGDHDEHGAGGGKLPGAPGALRPRVCDARVCPCARPARRAAAGPVGVSGLRVCAADVTTEQLQQILQNVQAELERRAALQRGAPESKRCVPPLAVAALAPPWRALAAHPRRRNSMLCASGKALPSEAEVHAWALLVLLHGRGADGSWVAVPTLVDQWMNVVLLQSTRYEQAPALLSHRPPSRRRGCYTSAISRLYLGYISALSRPCCLSRVCVLCAVARAMAASDRRSGVA